LFRPCFHDVPHASLDVGMPGFALGVLLALGNQSFGGIYGPFRQLLDPWEKLVGLCEVEDRHKPRHGRNPGGKPTTLGYTSQALELRLPTRGATFARKPRN